MNTPLCLGTSHCFLQVNEMLGAQYTNFVPAAVGAGLLPLLSTVLAKPSSDRSAVLRCLRLTTDKPFGARMIAQNTQLVRSALDACIAVTADVVSDRVYLTSSTRRKPFAVRASTDAMHIAANILAAGAYARH
jgi:hypothetical protein